ncbi:hypothetical protein [Chengkuizengella axinellae]|uniref:Uncharacterized protein n=1 Tax=Chengkuizengella axinellae TaxID=3064388 RepID=A0ABT9J0C7_9BACL|nr:hypothetical protein [Chengkuizengella sp. 2205SS18-9]MDP5274470.1 hypothetical protein [Chengkuizengella sp. 2205SS18-9]
MFNVIAVLYIYFLPFVAIVFFTNFVSIVKKIHKGEDTFYNTFWGAILFAIIISGLFYVPLSG